MRSRDLLVGGGALVLVTAVVALLSRREAAAAAPPGAPRVRPLPPAPPAPAGWERWAGARPEPRGWPENTILAVPGIDRVSPEARRKLLDLCADLDMPVDSIAAVIASESGWKAWNAYGVQKDKDDHPLRGADGTYLLSKANRERVQAGQKPFFAVGLVQLTTGANLPGFETGEQLLQVLEWSAEEQLDRIVRPLYVRHGAVVQGADPGRIYMVNFLPKFAREAPDYVLGDRDSDDGGLRSRFEMNEGFDANGDGKILVQEVTAAARRQCVAAKGRRIGVDGTLYEPAAGPAAAAPPAPKKAAPVAPAAPSAAPDTSARISTPAPATPASPGPAVAPKGSTTAMLLEAVRTGTYEKPTWVEVPWRSLRVRVGAHCLRAPVKLGTGETRLLRLGVSWRDTLEICRLLDWTAPTAELVDEIYAAAAVKLDPVTLPAGPEMSSLNYAVKYNTKVDAQIPVGQADLLAAPEGKDWIWSRRLQLGPRLAVTYGWHCKTTCGNGKPLWQGLGPDDRRPAHDDAHNDYSQTLRPIDRLALAEDGTRVDLLDEFEKTGLPKAVFAPLR